MLFALAVIAVMILFFVMGAKKTNAVDAGFAGMCVGFIVWVLLSWILAGNDIVEETVVFNEFEILGIAEQSAIVNYDGRQSLMPIEFTEDETHVVRVDGPSNWLMLTNAGVERLRLNPADVVDSPSS